VAATCKHHRLSQKHRRTIAHSQGVDRHCAGLSSESGSRECSTGALGMLVGTLVGGSDDQDSGLTEAIFLLISASSQTAQNAEGLGEYKPVGNGAGDGGGGLQTIAESSTSSLPIDLDEWA